MCARRRTGIKDEKERSVIFYIKITVTAGVIQQNSARKILKIILFQIQGTSRKNYGNNFMLTNSGILLNGVLHCKKMINNYLVQHKIQFCKIQQTL